MTRAREPLILDDVERAVDEIIARVGKTVAIGMPLGLGKPVQLVNALYARAKRDPTLKLRIFSALSLEKPRGSSKLERAFLEPFVERVYGDCPEVAYVSDQRDNRLPANVEVMEFFFRPGSMLASQQAQQSYISSNYTHAARDVFAQGCNVAAQLVCKRETRDGVRYSLSCNPDTSPELIELLRASGRPHVTVALVNQKLPFMGNDAEVGADYFDVVVDSPRYETTLFSTPKLALTTPDYMIGLYASALIRDGGTLQIGIGALGDAIVYATQLRHQQNNAYRRALSTIGALDNHQALIDEIGGEAPFAKGLYGATEMFVDGFLHLYRAGILKRRVYDFWALQQLINEGRCDPDDLRADVLDALESLGVRVIRSHDFAILQHHGFFNDATRYDQGYLVAPDGERVIANVADAAARRVIAAKCLGKKLQRGYLLHGGFFLGPRDFYEALGAMSGDERAQICMTGVAKINQLDHNPRLYKQQRKDARFVNTGIMATLSGGIVSDGLEDGRVISGVGGQYNFVAMAHQLLTGRSILLIRAVRDKEGKTEAPTSNIVHHYAHSTIPRHLRDIVITEYGIADLRSKTDGEIIQALLNVADSRFQQSLLDEAKRHGKIARDYAIAERFRHNTPQRLEASLQQFRSQGLFPAFPLGCDFTAEELALGKALRGMKARVAKTKKWRLALAAWRFKDDPLSARPYLRRMKLESPKSFEDKVARMLLIEQLRSDGAI
ncbi:MAG TPA: acetyl-CoA hydrolase/transferase C-terminal domain-containing protein [Nevskiaceae bacterium]|nr:acetyl-CoA hydrolase/transferase C-terminal domain-containing protein [Nevskiaceae bacterium]